MRQGFHLQAWNQPYLWDYKTCMGSTLPKSVLFSSPVQFRLYSVSIQSSDSATSVLKFDKASPLSGWLCDRYGTEWITILSLAISAPWLILLMIKTNLAFFVSCVAITSLWNTDLDSSNTNRGCLNNRLLSFLRCSAVDCRISLGCTD